MEEHTEFVDIPLEIRRDILLRESLNKSRLLSSTYQNLLLRDFINDLVSNPTAINEDEVLVYIYRTQHPFVMGYSNQNVIKILTFDTHNDSNNNDNNDMKVNERTTIIDSLGHIESKYNNILIDREDMLLYVANSSLFDAKLMYCAFKERLLQLDPNISDRIIKVAVHNIISKYMNVLLSVHVNALFMYLVRCLNVLGIDTTEYKTLIGTIRTRDALIQHRALDEMPSIDLVPGFMPPGLLEEMMDIYRMAINELSCDIV